MSPKDLASLAFKLAGIFSIIQAMAYASMVLAMVPLGLSAAESNSFLEMIGEAPINIGMIVSSAFVGIGLLGGFGMFLIRGSESLADRVIVDEAFETGLRAVDVHAVLFSVLGAYFVGNTAYRLPNLIRTVHAYTSGSGPDAISEFVRYELAWVTGLVLQLAVGLVLLFKARRVATLFSPSEAAAKPERPSRACPNCRHPYSPEDYRDDAEQHLCSKCGSVLPD